MMMMNNIPAQVTREDVEVQRQTVAEALVHPNLPARRLPLRCPSHPSLNINHSIINRLRLLRLLWAPQPALSISTNRYLHPLSTTRRPLLTVSNTTNSTMGNNRAPQTLGCTGAI